MSHHILLYMKPYIQPFEGRLARWEAQSLCGVDPSRTSNDDLWYFVACNVEPGEISRKLVYWEAVKLPGRPEQLTAQVRLEGTANLVLNGVSLQEIAERVPFQDTASVPVPRRRVLRYGTHGIHEYRGKFFPQLVGALLNIFDLIEGATVLDPFCGSGTGPVEVRSRGYRAFAVDLNPLSVYITQAKLAAFDIDPDELQKEYVAVESDLRTLGTRNAPRATREWFSTLPSVSRMYLSRWFPGTTLDDLDVIMLRLRQIRNAAIQRLFLVSLSNILRRVSFQKTDDLRVRLDPDSAEPDVAQVFLSELNRSVRHVFAFLREYRRHDAKLLPYVVRCADARHLAEVFVGEAGKIDAVITSPPYATALPYIDTDRLSLAYLNLLDRQEQRRLEREMIGTREITNGEVERGWRRFLESEHLLPDRVRSIIHRVHEAGRQAKAVGFRRRNLPSLLARYFLDMRQVFEQLLVLLKPGAPAAFVVGSNHTVIGGERIDIDTAGLLAEVASTVGFSVEYALNMEMLVSRDIFRANASDRETLVFLRKP